jgi:CRP/FNR family cyclic AMP-dependent transcriptional regulator
LMKTGNWRDLLKELTEGRHVNKYKKKQVIYVEGNRPGKIFFIQKGKVKTYKRNDNGKDLVVELYSQGDFLGYTAMLEGTSYKETAEPIEDTELAVIPKEDFEKLINYNQQVARQFIKMLVKNIREKEDHLLALAYDSLRKKVANALITLDKKYNPGQSDNFSIDISRESLASIAGTATESLIRTLSDFKNENLIEMDHGSIFLRDKNKLETMFT